jgi:hypothetical protein
MQEEIGTGGAGFRFLYAAFLQEAAQITGEKTATVDMPRGDQPAGRVRHDERGVAVWDWAVASGEFQALSATRAMKKLGIADLKIEDTRRDAPVLSLEPADVRGIDLAERLVVLAAAEVHLGLGLVGEEGVAVEAAPRGRLFDLRAGKPAGQLLIRSEAGEIAARSAGDVEAFFDGPCLEGHQFGFGVHFLAPSRRVVMHTP